MDLSSEDSFRLNVLLANKPLAIRIDESRLTVHGLSTAAMPRSSSIPQGEWNPTCVWSGS